MSNSTRQVTSIIVVILLYHITMDPKGIGRGLFAALLEVFLIYAYWPHFSGVCIVVKRPG